MIEDDARAKLEEYLTAWFNRDWDKMWKATQLTSQKLVQWTILQDMMAPMRLVSFEVLQAKEHDESSWYIDFRVRHNFDRPVVATFDSTYRVVREVEAYKPTSEGGTWGVNPISGLGLEPVSVP